MEVWAKGAVFLMALQAISLLHQPSIVAGDILSPLLSPVLNGLCNAVYCGKGNCKVSSNHAFGFVCDCSPGWSQFHMEDHFRFLPCLIPNCSINYSCSNTSGPAAAPPPSPAPPDNSTLFDCKHIFPHPHYYQICFNFKDAGSDGNWLHCELSFHSKACSWSFCGGGDCVRSSTFEHHCECKLGYSNLLNKTSFPCYKDCSIGADCANLGINLSNSSSSSSSSSSSPNVADDGDHRAAKNLLWLVMLMMVFLLMM